MKLKRASIRLRHLIGVEVFLEAREDLADLLRLAEVGHGVGDGVLVFQAQQGAEFLLLWLVRRGTNSGPRGYMGGGPMRRRFRRSGTAAGWILPGGTGGF